MKRVVGRYIRLVFVPAIVGVWSDEYGRSVQVSSGQKAGFTGDLSVNKFSDFRLPG